MKTQNRLTAEISALLPVLFLAMTAARAEKPRAEKPAYDLGSAPLSIVQKTAVPGIVLKPGDYSIHIIDQLKDRYILQVEDSAGKPLSTFIGLHTPDFRPGVAPGYRGPIFWAGAPRGEKAMRGFSFPGNTVELVYPKAEAVALAKLNANTVPAIDPESEGRAPDLKLSLEDREVVTLWMLTATRVGPDNTPAIDAKRFVLPPGEPGPAVRWADATASPAPQPSQTRPAPVQIAQASPSDAPRIHSSVKKLPQTASDLPLMLLLALVSLSAAAALRFTREQI